MEMNEVYIALGSNLGDRLNTLNQAVALLSCYVQVEKVSQVWETAPMYYENQQSFFNCVLKGTTSLSPEMLLEKLHETEQALGRKREIHYGPRTIDLDILFFQDQVQNTETLILPHPRISERFFVLVPLNELAPQLVHPITKKTVSKMLGELENCATRDETVIHGTGLEVQIPSAC